MANKIDDRSCRCCTPCAKHFLSVVFGEKSNENYWIPGGPVVPDNVFQDILRHVRESVRLTLINHGYYDTDEKNDSLDRKINEVYESMEKDLNDYVDYKRKQVEEKVITPKLHLCHPKLCRESDSTTEEELLDSSDTEDVPEGWVGSFQHDVRSNKRDKHHDKQGIQMQYHCSVKGGTPKLHWCHPKLCGRSDSTTEEELLDSREEELLDSSDTEDVPEGQVGSRESNSTTAKEELLDSSGTEDVPVGEETVNHHVVDNVDENNSLGTYTAFWEDEYLCTWQ